MKNNYAIKGLIIALAVFTCMQANSGTRKRILYLAGTSYATTDIQLTTRLANSYDLTILGMTATTVSEIAQSTNANYARNFDAIYLSESVGTSSMPNGLLTLNVPVINTKFLVAPPLKWGLTDNTTSQYDVATLADAVVTINSTNSAHPLAAGLSGDISLVTDGTVSASNVYLNALVTPLNIIKIATLKSDATKNVVFGVEPGASLYCTNTTYPMSAATKRIANIGFHVSCINNLTESAYKLVEAAIEWCTATTTDNSSSSTNTLSISLTDKNIFRIDCSAIQKGNISVYSSVGKRIFTTTISNFQAIINLSGQYKGVFIAKINGNNQSYTQKIVVE